VPRRAAALFAVALAGCTVPETEPVRYVPASYAALPGWTEADPRPALAAFRLSCADAPSSGAARPSLPIGAEALERGRRAACAAAAVAAPGDAAAARLFFERHFAPYRVLGSDGAEGLFTGYYEPLLAASRRRRPGYEVPIHAPPPGAREGALPARAEIETSAAAKGWPALFWAADQVEVFTLHIQGSGRLALAEGGFARVAYAGNNAHGYVAIGRLMRERGLLPPDGTNMPAIAAWLRANPDAGRALMRENPRYIFFREVADAEGVRGQPGVRLTPRASLAVDRDFIPLGLPLWLDAKEPLPPHAPLRALMVAQDVGAAIRGPVRGDIFFGAGADAARAAGHMASRGRYFLLLPTAN
jgi:membrane-bound lytic murein transglycosylase A